MLRGSNHHTLHHPYDTPRYSALPRTGTERLPPSAREYLPVVPRWTLRVHRTRSCIPWWLLGNGGSYRTCARICRTLHPGRNDGYQDCPLPVRTSAGSSHAPPPIDPTASCGPERTRTSDTRFRKPVFYPAELRGRR